MVTVTRVVHVEIIMYGTEKVLTVYYYRNVLCLIFIKLR
jgi:hypothetical protein